MQSTSLHGLGDLSADNQAQGQHVGAQTQKSVSNAGPRNYSSMTFHDHTLAILGDVAGNVNISTSSLPYLQNANPADQRWLLLRSLYFENMGARKAQIQARAASPKYVDWVWTTSFLPWLEGPDTLYWVTGKAGSGKSTLMMHISDSFRTKEALQKNGMSWKVTRFFFDFRAGSSLGNSIHGLLRSLLYQTVQQVPEVVQYLDHSLFDGGNHSWTFQDCLDNLCEAVNTSTYRICAFIDGLDEFEGPYSELISLIQTLQERTGSVAGIKLCLASRPYPTFRESFGKNQQLIMQDHNDASIEMYTSSQWLDHRIDHRAELPQDLCTRIRKKANGVFLWARLAVDELLVDFIARKPLAALYEQLDSMPEEVEAMYQRCLDRLPESQQQEAAAILYILLQSESREIPIRKLYAALEGLQSLGYAGQHILPVDTNADNRPRLLAILGDLTDQHEQERSIRALPPFSLTVQNGVVKCTRDPEQVATLTHETLRSFLKQSAWFTQILSPELSRNTSHLFWTHLYLSEITLRMMSRPKDVSLELHIRKSTTEFSHEMNQALRISPIRFHSSSLADLERTLCDICTGALGVLNEWKNWSSLLLFAVADVWDHISKLPNSPTALTHRIAPLINSAVFSLHISICNVQSCLNSLSESPDRAYSLETDMFDATCAYLTLNLPQNKWSSSHELLVMAAHSLGELVPSLIKQDFLSSYEKQLIFDVFLENFIRPIEGPIEAQIEGSKLALDYLLDIGCELTGKYLCRSYLTIVLNDGSHEVANFFARNLSYEDLSHDPNCQNYHSSSSNMVAHLKDYVDTCRMQFVEDDYDMILTALIKRGADFNQYLEVEGENFLVDQIGPFNDLHRPMDELDCAWNLLEIVLDAGCDPYARGNQGNAFEYISAKIANAKYERKAEGVETLEEIQKRLYAYVEEKGQASTD